MSDIKLGPWPKGMDNISEQTKLKGAARDAVNGDFDRDGQFSRRKSAVMQEAGAFHSAWSGQTAYVAQGSMLYQLMPDLTRVALGMLNSAEPVSYDTLNGETVIGNRSTLVVHRGDSLVPIGIDRPGAPTVTAAAAGGLSAGTYGVAISLLRDAEESALSNITVTTVGEGGGLLLDLPDLPPDITAVRIYRTGQNGDALYKAADAPAGMTTYMVGTGQLGRVADTQNLDRLPAGEIVRAWNGRLLVARGRFLYFSQPMRYGLYSPRHDFVQFSSRIVMVGPVEGGVFVATKDGKTVFLAGKTPKEWNVIKASAAAAIPRADSRFDTRLLDEKLQIPPSEAWIWLTVSGYAVGLPSGQVIQPQEKRLNLPLAESGALLVSNRRITTLVK